MRRHLTVRRETIRILRTTQFLAVRGGNDAPSVGCALKCSETTLVQNSCG